MKKCSCCKVSKSMSEFAVNKSRVDGRAKDCKLCHREYSQSHYRDNKKYYLERNKRRSEEIKSYLEQYLRGRTCVDCSEKDPVVLDFDHVRGIKLFNIADAPSLKYGIKALREELGKCEIVCSNCHRRRTAKRRLRVSLAGKTLGSEPRDATFEP